jgi:hypothetical protein
MRHGTCGVVAAVVLVVIAGEASAQSLADIAEKEKKRRAERQAKGTPPAKVVSLENWQGWQTFQPSEGDFSVQFPARPRASEDLVVLPEAKTQQRVFQAAKDNVIFSVATLDLASTPYDRLPPLQLLKVLSSNHSSTRDVPCTPISLDGHPGCEAQRDGVRADYGSETADITWRFYVVKRRIYILTYVHRNNSGPAAEPSGPFFDSFAPRP